MHCVKYDSDGIISIKFQISYDKIKCYICSDGPISRDDTSYKSVSYISNGVYLHELIAYVLYNHILYIAHYFICFSTILHLSNL